MTQQPADRRPWPFTPENWDEQAALRAYNAPALQLQGVNSGPNTEGIAPDPSLTADLDTRRRQAFLGASDSMSGLRAVRSLLADEAKAQGADISGGGSIPSIRFLEREIAKRQPTVNQTPIADVSDNDRAVLQQMQFPGNPITQVSQARVPDFPGSTDTADGGWGTPGLTQDQLRAALKGDLKLDLGFKVTPAAGQTAWGQHGASGFRPERDMTMRPYGEQGMQTAFGGAARPPSEAARATVNAWLQDALAERIRNNPENQPLNQVADWQMRPVPITAPKTDPGRDAKLAAFAAQGEQPPTTQGDAFLALAAGGPLGSTAGLWKQGNTVNLGHLDPSQLPRLNSRIHISNPGNFFGGRG